MIMVADAVTSAKQLYAKKGKIGEIFGLSARCGSNYVTEMQTIPEFSSAVIKLESNNIIVHIETFERFLKWKNGRYLTEMR